MKKPQTNYAFIDSRNINLAVWPSVEEIRRAALHRCIGYAGLSVQNKKDLARDRTLERALRERGQDSGRNLIKTLSVGDVYSITGHHRESNQNSKERWV